MLNPQFENGDPARSVCYPLTHQILLGRMEKIQLIRP